MTTQPEDIADVSMGRIGQMMAVNLGLDPSAERGYIIIMDGDHIDGTPDFHVATNLDMTTEQMAEWLTHAAWHLTYG